MQSGIAAGSTVEGSLVSFNVHWIWCLWSIVLIFWNRNVRYLNWICCDKSKTSTESRSSYKGFQIVGLWIEPIRGWAEIINLKTSARTHINAEFKVDKITTRKFTPITSSLVWKLLERKLQWQSTNFKNKLTIEQRHQVVASKMFLKTLPEIMYILILVQLSLKQSSHLVLFSCFDTKVAKK